MCFQILLGFTAYGRRLIAYLDGSVVCAVSHRACEDALLDFGHLGIELVV